MIIISLYCLIEVSYYSSADNISKNSSNTPYLEIPSIGIDQPINNKSVDYGIYYDPGSSRPGFGTTAIFGHRTFHGSPFLNLDKLKKGDNISIEWPGIGDVEYSVVNLTIVDPSYRLNVDQGNKLFLITCYPLGSDAQRLIIEANQVKIDPVTTNQKHSTNPPYAILIIIGFFVGGSILSFLYPLKEDQYIIFLVTIAITAFLILAYLFPIPPDAIEAQLSWFNNLLGV
jgi:sortase A